MASARDVLAFICAGIPADDVPPTSHDAVLAELMQLARLRYELETAATAVVEAGTPYQAALGHGIRALLAQLLQAAAELESDALEDAGITPYHVRYHLRDFIVTLPAVARVAAACQPLRSGSSLRSGALLEALHAQTKTGDAAMKATFLR
jgi:hypothetical protein